MGGSFVLCGRGPAYSGQQRWDLYIGPMRQPRDRMIIGRCVHCMCRVEEGTVGVSSLSGISKCTPLGVAYCLAMPGLALIQHLATWLTLLQRLARGLSHICLLRLSCQCDWYLDAANEGISNGRSLYGTPSNPLTCPGLTPCSSCA